MATQQLFEQIDSYDYDHDPEFQLGLSSILSHAESPSQRADLQLRARCFYYARKNGRVPIDFDSYKKWKTNLQQPSSSSPSSSPSSLLPLPLPTTTTTTEEQQQQLPAAAIQSSRIESSTTAGEGGASFSYAQIVDMIQSGKEIPGIMDVPDTVLDGQATVSTRAKRRKPWETTETAEAVVADSHTDSHTDSHIDSHIDPLAAAPKSPSVVQV
jgi:hypothetical protein